MKKFLHIMVTIFFATAFAACGLEDPQRSAPSTPSGTGEPQDPSQPTPSTPSLAPPAIDPLPATVCTDTVALRGNTNPQSSVIVRGGIYDVTTDAEASTGAFCIDVPLKKNQLNTLEVKVHDAELGWSEAKIVTTTHQDCENQEEEPDPTTEQPQSTNIASIAEITSDPDPAFGEHSSIIDGDTSTFTRYMNIKKGWPCVWLCDVPGWVALKLDKIYSVQKIVVNWPNSKGIGNGWFGVKYQVLISTETDPGDPDPDNGHWTPIQVYTDGDGGLDVIDFGNAPLMFQHLALWLEKNGKTSYREFFEISEIEIWETADIPSTPPVTTGGSHTCAGGAGVN